MRALSILSNPVQQAYDGGDQVNIRQLKNFVEGTANNFASIETAVQALEAAHKAHHTVMDSFDKANRDDEYIVPMTAGGAA